MPRALATGLRRFSGRAIALYLIIVRRTGRWTMAVHPEAAAAMDAPAPVIIAFHHGRFAMTAFARRGRRFVAMVSRSKDGDLIAATLHGLGVETARGSPKSGGPAAQRAILKAMETGVCAAIATDGPKGPRGVSKPGVAHLAAVSRAPTIPVSFAAKRAIRAKSWDAMVIPPPFAGGAIVAGAPLPPPEAGAEATFLKSLDEALDAATAEAETRVSARTRRAGTTP